MKKIIIINGPNLNLLGKRQPEIYGNITFEDFFKELKSSFESIQLEYYQSNVEGDLVNKLQEVGFSIKLRTQLSEHPHRFEETPAYSRPNHDRQQDHVMQIETPK